MARESTANARARRANVLEVSMEMFSRQGYRGTTMNDIAAEVGLGKPSLYHYFRSKEQILIQLYETVLDESLATALEIVEQTPNSLDAFRSLLVWRVVQTSQHREMFKVFFEEEGELPTSVATNLIVRRREFEDIFKLVVSTHLRTHGIELPTSLSVYVNTCLGAVNWVYKWYDPTGPMSAERLGNEIADLLIQPLAPPHQAPRPETNPRHVRK